LDEKIPGVVQLNFRIFRGALGQGLRYNIKCISSAIVTKHYYMQPKTVQKGYVKITK